MKWTKAVALAELAKLDSEIDKLLRVRRQSAEHTRWLANTLRVLEQIFGPDSRYFKSIAVLPWHRTGSFIMHGWDIEEQREQIHHEAYLHQLEHARGLLRAAVDELQVSDLAGVFRSRTGETGADEVLTVLALVERKLRKLLRVPPEKEREVQDALENLLIGADIAYSREGESIEYSSKTYIPDFRVPSLDLVIEVKLCARPDREKGIIAEINDDVLAYRVRHRNLLFVVYDTGHIRDVERFAEPLQADSAVLVRVVKH